MGSAALADYGRRAVVKIFESLEILNHRGEAEHRIGTIGGHYGKSAGWRDYSRFDPI
jgi:hypothetical protein